MVGIILLLVVTYFLLSKSGLWREFRAAEEVRQQERAAYYQQHGKTSTQARIDGLGSAKRKSYPKRAKGAPLIHRSVLKASLPWVVGAAGLLIYVGLVSQQLLFVAVMAIPVLLLGGLALRWAERPLREEDSVVAKFSFTEQDLFVPEDWSKK